MFVVGNLRSKLVTEPTAIHSLSWSPDQSSLLYCCGRYVTIKPIISGAKPISWLASDNLITCSDWNPINNFIITGAEDCKFKIWDSFGLLLFTSKPQSNFINSVSWSPNGEYFAVGLYNEILLCDKAGRFYLRITNYDFILPILS